MKKLFLALMLVLSFTSAQAATYNVANSKHATLVLLTVDTVNLSGVCSYVNVYNVGLTDMYVRFDGTNPTVTGDDAFRVDASGWRRLVNPTPYTSQVKLISAAGMGYSVECE